MLCRVLWERIRFRLCVYSPSTAHALRRQWSLEFLIYGYTSEGELDKGSAGTSVLFLVIW